MKRVKAIAKYTSYSGIKRDGPKVHIILLSKPHPRRLFAMNPVELTTSLSSDYELQHSGFHRENGKYYKVLGSISSSADWVKEGDEITCKIESYRSFECIKPPTVHGPGNKSYEAEITDLDIAYVQCPGPCEIYH